MSVSVGTIPDTWVGSIVLSLAGRDSKRLFVIVSSDEENGYVYIADGKLRQIQHPKKKKIKHIQVMQVGDVSFALACKGSAVTNNMIQNMLASYASKQR